MCFDGLGRWKVVARPEPRMFAQCNSQNCQGNRKKGGAGNGSSAPLTIVLVTPCVTRLSGRSAPCNRIQMEGR